MQNFLRSTIMTDEYQNVASQAIHGNSRAVFVSHFYFRYHTITCDMSNKTSIVRDCKRPWSESVGTQLTKSTKHEHSGREDKNHRNEIFFWLQKLVRKTEPLNTVIMPIFGDGVLGRDGYHIALRAFFKKKKSHKITESKLAKKSTLIIALQNLTKNLRFLRLLLFLLFLFCFNTSKLVLS